MATLTLTLPVDYGYVVAVAFASTFVNSWHAFRVTPYRKAAAVEWPNAYASITEANKSMEKYQFNCAQRAQANFIEGYPNFIVSLIIGGITYPRMSAACGVIYLVGKIVYSMGYTRPKRDGGKGRYQGAFNYIGLIGMTLLGCNTVYQMLVKR